MFFMQAAAFVIRFTEMQMHILDADGQFAIGALAGCRDGIIEEFDCFVEVLPLRVDLPRFKKRLAVQLEVFLARNEGGLLRDLGTYLLDDLLQSWKCRMRRGACGLERLPQFAELRGFFKGEIHSVFRLRGECRKLRICRKIHHRSELASLREGFFCRNVARIEPGAKRSIAEGTLRWNCLRTT